MEASDYKRKTEGYLAFSYWMDRNKKRYHKKLFDEDIMYFCKLWKAHRQLYIMECKRLMVFHDGNLFDQRCYQYEKALLDKGYHNGLLTDKQYREKLSELCRTLQIRNP